MRYVVKLTMVIDTDNYDDVKDANDVRSLVDGMIEGTADWPREPTKIEVVRGD